MRLKDGLEVSGYLTPCQDSAVKRSKPRCASWLVRSANLGSYSMPLGDANAEERFHIAMARQLAPR